MRGVKTMFLLGVCVLALGACQNMPSSKQAGVAELAPPPEIVPPATITNPDAKPAPSDLPSLAYGGDDRVQVFPLDGPVVNPLSTDRSRMATDNSTAGGFTVLAKGVTVYSLDDGATAGPSQASGNAADGSDMVGDPNPRAVTAQKLPASSGKSVKKAAVLTPARPFPAAGARSAPMLTGN